MTYANQMDHSLLDRKSIRDLLMSLSKAKVLCAPTPMPRAAHLESLMKQCDTKLEREWLALLERHNLRLPTHAQKRFEECGTRPDFYYQDSKAAIYVDGLRMTILTGSSGTGNGRKRWRMPVTPSSASSTRTTGKMSLPSFPASLAVEIGSERATNMNLEGRVFDLAIVASALESPLFNPFEPPGFYGCRLFSEPT